MVLLSFNIKADDPPRCAYEDSVCVVAIFPHTGIKQIRQNFGALVEDISFELDVETRLATTNSLKSFVDKLNNDHYDIALVGPSMYVRLKENNDYIPIARPKEKITFQIVTLQKSNIHSLGDLAGKRFGQLYKHSGTWLVNTVLLKKAGVFDKITEYEEYATSHACAYALASDLVDACGIAAPLLRIIEKQIPFQFRILKTHSPLPSSVYIAHKNIPLRKLKQLSKYLIQNDRLVKAKNSDYDSIRSLIAEFDL